MPLSVRELPIAAFSAIVFASFFGFITWFNWSDYHFRRQLERDGIRTTAEITKVEFVKGANGDGNIKVDYVYQVERNIYMHNTEVHIPHPEGWIVGESIEIRYLPENPKKSQILGNERSPSLIEIILPGSIGLFLAVFSPLYFLLKKYPNHPSNGVWDYPPAHG